MALKFFSYKCDYSDLDHISYYLNMNPNYYKLSNKNDELLIYCEIISYTLITDDKLKYIRKLMKHNNYKFVIIRLSNIIFLDNYDLSLPKYRLLKKLKLDKIIVL